MTVDEIRAAKRRELARSKVERTPADLKAKARNAQPLRPFPIRLPDRLAILAEFRRPGAADPERHAAEALDAGATGLSVWTDAIFHGGSVEDLRATRLASALPLLRRDYVLGDYQLLEARVMLADAATLTAALLERSQLSDLLAMAREDLKLATLVEVRDEREAEKAVAAGAAALLFVPGHPVSLEAAARLRHLIPPGVAVAIEDGPAGRGEAAILRKMGIDAALLAPGEGRDLGTTIRELIDER